METNQITIYSPETLSTSVLELFLRSKSPSTRIGYERDLKDFFQATTGADPSMELLNQFLKLERGQAEALLTLYKADMAERRGLKPAMINRRLCAVRSLVRFARHLGCCEIVLDVDGAKSKPYRDTRGIEVAQIRKVLSQPNRETVKGKRDYAILRLLWDCALRRSELCKINFCDFDAGAKTLRIYGKGKGKEETIMELNDRTVKAILEWLDVRTGAISSDAPIFTALNPGGDGRRLTGESIRKLVVDYCDRAGVDRVMSPHRIRHSAITAALDATDGNVRKVQKLSRHADIKTLMIYDDNRHRHQAEVTGLLADLV